MTLDTANQQEVAYQTKPELVGHECAWLVLQVSSTWWDIVNGSKQPGARPADLGQRRLVQQLPAQAINQLATRAAGQRRFTRSSSSTPRPPYMLSGNTVWLEPNTTKAPMSNVNFRRALAYATEPVGDRPRRSTVAIAAPANPTGLLPTLQERRGFVDLGGGQGRPALPTTRRWRSSCLAQSGYHGQTLTLEAPQGWSDWNTAQQVDPAGAAAGWRQHPGRHGPSANQRTADLTNGNYDLALDNNAGLDSTPWSYFQRGLPAFRSRSSSPPRKTGERFSSADGLEPGAAGRPPSRHPNTAQLNQIYSTLEKDFLQQQPEIPLWYNGVWFQGNTQYWQDFPSSTGSDQNIPAMWNGYIGAMTTVPRLWRSWSAVAQKAS